MLLELRGALLLRNAFHLFPPVNVDATTLLLEGEIRGKLRAWKTRDETPERLLVTHACGKAEPLRMGRNTSCQFWPSC
jgi:hypothetical protein